MKKELIDFIHFLLEVAGIPIVIILTIYYTKNSIKKFFKKGKHYN